MPRKRKVFSRSCSEEILDERKTIRDKDGSLPPYTVNLNDCHLDTRKPAGTLKPLTDEHTHTRPKDLFFMKNTKLKNSIESLLSNDSEAVSDSEDELTEEILEEWYASCSGDDALEDTERSWHSKHKRSTKSRTRRHSSDSQCSVDLREGRLKSQELISVKPERVASLIVKLREQCPSSENISTLKDFLKVTAIPLNMTDEESFFVYCYVYGTSRWNVVARINKEGRMVAVKLARRYGNRCSQKSDLTEKEIDGRMLELASTHTGDLPSLSALSRDPIPYDRLEEDSEVLEDFLHMLQRRRSNPLAVAKWFLCLRARVEADVESFLQFDETFHELEDELKDHEKFCVYALIYGQKTWKVELERERKKVTGVYVSFRQLPKHLRDYNESSDQETVYDELTQIALSDRSTRTELRDMGFQLPAEDEEDFDVHVQSGKIILFVISFARISFRGFSCSTSICTKLRNNWHRNSAENINFCRSAEGALK